MKISGHMIAALTGLGIALNELALKSAVITNALNPANRIVPSLMGCPRCAGDDSESSLGRKPLRHQSTQNEYSMMGE
jgi:hypothetical protein